MYYYIKVLQNNLKKKTGQKKIFIIDDDTKYLNLLKEVFCQKSEFIVKTYYDGHMAMKDFITDRPDILILDNDMPKITGIDIVKALKNDMKNLHILVVTSNFNAITTFQQLGIKDFLPKPFSIRELFSIVNNF